MTHDKRRKLRKCRLCAGARTRDNSRLCTECRRSEDTIEQLVEAVMAAFKL